MALYQFEVQEARGVCAAAYAAFKAGASAIALALQSIQKLKLPGAGKRPSARTSAPLQLLLLMRPVKGSNKRTVLALQC